MSCTRCDAGWRKRNRLPRTLVRRRSMPLEHAAKEHTSATQAPPPAPDGTNESQESPFTPTLTSTGAKTEKLSFKAAWGRFRAHVLPDGQTLLSKKVTVIGS